MGTTSARRKPIILIVEDDRTFAMVYKLRLEHDGFSVQIVGDGQRALDFLSSHTPDLIVLDLILPVMDGFEVLKRIRSNAKWKQLKVIVLTVLGQESDRAKIETLGVSGYYVKSMVSLHDVAKSISALVKTS